MDNLKPEVRNAKHISVTEKNCYRKEENSLFSIHIPVGVKILTRLWLQLSHLNEHKFRDGFEEYKNRK